MILRKKEKSRLLYEMTDDLIKALGICAANSGCLRDLLRYYKVPVYLESTLREICDNQVVIQTTEGEKTIDCDSVVLSVGYVPGTPLAKEASEHVHILGDVAKVGNLKSVIWGAYDLAFSL